MKSRKWVLILVALVLALGGGTVWAVRALRASVQPPPEPVVLEMKGAMQELAEEVRKGTPMENKTALLAKMAQLGQEMRDLDPDQRKLAMKNFNAVAMEYMRNYFQLPKEEQTRQLDSIIDMFQLAQKMGNLFGGPRGNRDSQGQGAAGEGSQGSAEQGQNKGPDGMTPDQRDNWRREMIGGMSTPEQRAMFGEYGRQLQQRAQERGVQIGPQRP